MSINGFVLPPRITLEEATRTAHCGVKRKLPEPEQRHTKKGDSASGAPAAATSAD